MSSFHNLKQAVWLDNLVLQFYKGQLKFSLEPEDVQLFTWDAQNNFLELTVNSERVKKYPGKHEFTRLFFKKLIDYLYDAQDIHDGFYETLAASALKTKKDDIFYYRHYVIGNDLANVITLKETSHLITNGTAGLRTWEAAKMLADWALSNPNEFSNKKVLELGSGVGLTGITIAKLCNTQSMYLTDFHPDVLATIAKNIEINFPESEQEELEHGKIFRNGSQEIGVMYLNWNDFERFPDGIAPDVIIGADIVYDPSTIEPLCKVLKKLFSFNTELKIYIQSVVRNPKTFHKFYYKLGSMNFKVEKIMQKQSTFIDWDVETKKHLLRITLPSNDCSNNE